MNQSSCNPLQPTEQPTIEASFAWLELCLQRLARLAPIAHARQLLELIPGVPLVSQQLILVELIKYDLAAAARGALAEQTTDPTGLARSLDFYWPAVESVLPRPSIPIDLILEEIHLRRRAGQTPRWQEYRQRFPDLSDTIAQWLAADQTKITPASDGKDVSEIPELALDAVVDDFHVLKQLGQGAFARVYLAKQLSMHRLVALKVSNHGSEEPQALSQLDHPNVVRVYDQRWIGQPAASLLYMQYLPGGTLADCIDALRNSAPDRWSGRRILESIDQHLLRANQSVPEHSPLRARLASMPWAEAVAWVGIQLADGLGYAAEQGVLHRDVKPANILLSAEAIPKLVDFNVSCSGLSGRAGAAAYFGGSLAYMSPEQLRVADPTDALTADQLDGRSDLYALGMLLWELWQGERPWKLMDLAANWTEAVKMQRRLRHQPFASRLPPRNPSERVLEKVLRSLLAVEPELRPQTGKETAARLRLALHPELATRFEPTPKSLAGRLLHLPVLLLAAVVIFGPNTAASIFNYDYNYRRMLEMQSVPHIVENFVFVSNWVNGIVYPLGVILFLAVMLPIARIVRRSQSGQVASQKEISALWNIGNRATLICGILWSVSGIVFALTFAWLHAEFSWSAALHFFLSLVLCGGVAWIYPYFGMTLLALLIYYPRVILPSMNDPGFSARCRRVRQHSRWYLLSAAAIPLTAVGALVFRDDLPRNLILAGVCLTGLGLAASFFAHQKLEETLRQFERVLGNAELQREL